MRMKAMFVRETLPAVDADVRPLSGVYPRVRREVMLEEEGLAALGARVGSLLGYAHLTAHVLLLLHLGLDLRGVDMGEHVAKVSGGTVGLAGRQIVGRCGCLVGRSGCSLHQNLIALLRGKLQRSDGRHKMLTHGMLVGRREN